MVKVLVLYDEEPDPQQYEAHAELCRCVPGGDVPPRQGLRLAVRRSDRIAIYAEWEFPDQDAFKAATRSEEFAATGNATRASAGCRRPTGRVRDARLADA